MLRDVAPSVEALVAGASERRPLTNADGKSGARLESVVLDGEPYVLKVFDVERDWLLRASGDLGCRAVALWEHGLYDAIPATVDHTVVGAAREKDSRVAALLMRDVSPWLVPEGSSVIELAISLSFSPCSRAWWAQNSSSPPEWSSART